MTAILNFSSLQAQLSRALHRGCTAACDAFLTAFYLLAAKFMRSCPRLARPVVFYSLYAYFLAKEWIKEHRSPLDRAGIYLAHGFCIVLLPLFFLFLSQAITLQSFPSAFCWLFTHAKASVLTVLFLSAVQLISRGLFHSYTIGAVFNALIVSLITLANYYKWELNGFPLMISDFSLFSNLGDILAFAIPEIAFSLLTLLSLLLFAAAIIAAQVLNRKLQLRRSVSSFLALSLALPLFLSALGPSATAYEIASLSKDCCTQEERLRECGILGGLYSAYANSKTADHSAYNSDNINRLNNLLYRKELEAAETKADEGGVRPHILFILSESFFDITRYEEISFAEDPIPVFHALSEKHTNGRFLSSTYAGGTGYVELEVLTGLNNNAIDETDTLSSLKRDDGDVYTALPSVARDLAEGNGYESIYIHSYTPALYNRAEVMASLGFDEVIFSDDFITVPQKDGYFISDHSLSEEVIRRFEQRCDGSPVFMQITSMENHRPYTADKYVSTDTVSFHCDGLSTEETVAIQTYLHGLSHADAALGELVDYFEDCGEPVMIVFYGDHLPTMQMSDSSLLYATLGRVSSSDPSTWTEEELAEMLSTDYLIWTNYEETTADDHAESSLFLGANALHRAGVTLSPFMYWLCDDASQKYLISRPRLFLSADGSTAASPSGSGFEAQRDHELMSYDLIYGDQTLLEYFHASADAYPFSIP